MTTAGILMCYLEERMYQIWRTCFYLIILMGSCIDNSLILITLRAIKFHFQTKMSQSNFLLFNLFKKCLT